MQNLPADLVAQIESAKSALKTLRYKAMRIRTREYDNAWQSNKYNTDPEHRERVKARCLAIYHRKRAEAAAKPENL